MHIKSRKTDDQIEIIWDKYEFKLGAKRVYFDNKNNIRIGKIETKYTQGLEQLLTKLTPDFSTATVTDSDVNIYLEILKEENVEAKKNGFIHRQKYIFKKLTDSYKRVLPNKLLKYQSAGVSIGKGLIILPSDPKELMKQLELSIYLIKRSKNLYLFVECDEFVNGTLSYIQRRKMRQKVVTDEETHHNPVVYCPFEVLSKR